MTKKETKELFCKKLIASGQKTFYMRCFIPTILAIGIVLCFIYIFATPLYLSQEIEVVVAGRNFYIFISTILQILWFLYLYLERKELIKLSKLGYYLTAFYPLVLCLLYVLSNLILLILPTVDANAIAPQMAGNILGGILYFVPHYIYFYKRRNLFATYSSQDNQTTFIFNQHKYIIVFISLLLLTAFAVSVGYFSYDYGFRIGIEEGHGLGEESGYAKAAKEYEENSEKSYSDGYSVGYYEGYENGKSIGYSEGHNDGYSNEYTIGKKENSNSKKNSIYSNREFEDDDDLCAIPSCNNSANTNSLYCFRHECFEVGCHEKTANDFCHYCIAHKCANPRCNSGRAYNSAYCLIHKD